MCLLCKVSAHIITILRYVIMINEVATVFLWAHNLTFVFYSYGKPTVNAPAQASRDSMPS